MKYLKVFQTESDYNAAKDTLTYPTVSHIMDGGQNNYVPIHKRPIKAVFYDSYNGTFVKLYPDQITEAIPTYTPIGVEVIPAEHDVYGTGQAGIMSLAEMYTKTPDVGSATTLMYMYWGGYQVDTSLPNYNKTNYIGKGTTLNDSVQGIDLESHLPSDQFTSVSSLDGISGYKYDSISYCQAPSPYNADGSRNEAYYTTAYSTRNTLSDFDGVGNSKVLTDLATGQSDWKTATTITMDYNVGYYPAACCCWRFHTAGTEQGQWYLPAAGELGYAINRFNAINVTINKVKSVYSSVIAIPIQLDWYWSSTERSGGSVVPITTNGNVRYLNKDDRECYARAFLRL